jgi:hypothetical protein
MNLVTAVRAEFYAPELISHPKGNGWTKKAREHVTETKARANFQIEGDAKRLTGQRLPSPREEEKQNENTH